MYRIGGRLGSLSLIHIWETAKKMAPYLTEKTVVVSVSKGIERDTNLRLSQVIQEETGNICKVAVLSGPSHAEEVGIRLPTGCVAACLDVDAARFVQDLSLIHISMAIITSAIAAPSWGL